MIAMCTVPIRLPATAETGSGAGIDKSPAALARAFWRPRVHSRVNSVPPLIGSFNLVSYHFRCPFCWSVLAFLLSQLHRGLVSLPTHIMNGCPLVHPRVQAIYSRATTLLIGSQPEVMLQLITLVPLPSTLGGIVWSRLDRYYISSFDTAEAQTHTGGFF